jgi:ribonuclease HI
VTVKKKLIVNCDGLCEPVNPAGVACYGFVVKQDEDTILYTEYGLVSSVKPFFPESNSNAAEYGSAIKAMEWLVKNGYAANNNNNDDDYQITLRGDCQLTIRKLKSTTYSSRAAAIIPLYDRAFKLRSRFGQDGITFEWVKREQNREADELAKKAYFWALKRYPKLQKRVRDHWATMLWLERTIYLDL